MSWYSDTSLRQVLVRGGVALVVCLAIAGLWDNWTPGGVLLAFGVPLILTLAGALRHLARKKSANQSASTRI